jgi:regulation of enolase protein 1 (concanavalin A-like superfamily)
MNESVYWRFLLDLLHISARGDLAWLNEPQQWAFTGETGVTITAPASADFFCDPGGVHVRHSAPFLSKEFEGDFRLTTRTSVDMVAQYDSSCIMFWLDAKNWAKLCFEYNGKHASIVSVVTKDGSSDDCNHCIVEAQEVALRVIRQGETSSLFFSLDEADWKLVRYFGFALPRPFQVGIVAQSPTGAGTQARFAYLDLSEPPARGRFA